MSKVQIVSVLRDAFKNFANLKKLVVGEKVRGWFGVSVKTWIYRWAFGLSISWFYKTMFTNTHTHTPHTAHTHRTHTPHKHTHTTHHTHHTHTHEYTMHRSKATNFTLKYAVWLMHFVFVFENCRIISSELSRICCWWWLGEWVGRSGSNGVGREARQKRFISYFNPN